MRGFVGSWISRGIWGCHGLRASKSILLEPDFLTNTLRHYTGRLQHRASSKPGFPGEPALQELLVTSTADPHKFSASIVLREKGRPRRVELNQSSVLFSLLTDSSVFVVCTCAFVSSLQMIKKKSRNTPRYAEKDIQMGCVSHRNTSRRAARMWQNQK